MCEVINERTKLSHIEIQALLNAIHNPNLDAIRKRDAFINSSREAVVLVDGIVSSVEIPDIDLSALDGCK
jgi:hypothetical protein